MGDSVPGILLTLAVGMVTNGTVTALGASNDVALGVSFVAMTLTGLVISVVRANTGRYWKSDEE
jgi:hypothetical protein